MCKLQSRQVYLRIYFLVTKCWIGWQISVSTMRIRYLYST